MAKTFNKIVAGALSSLMLMSSIPSAVYAANETIVTGNNTTSVSSDNTTIKGTVEPLIIKAVVPTVVAFDIDPNATGNDTLSAWKNAYTTVPFTFANECYAPLSFKVKTLAAQEGMPEIVLQDKYTDEQWADLTKTDTLSNIAFGFTVQDENWKSITHPDSWYKNNEIELGALSANTSADAELKAKYGLAWGNTAQSTITYDVTYEVGIEQGQNIEKVEGKTGDWEYVAAPNDMVQLTKYIGSDTDVTVPNFYEGKWVESVGSNISKTNVLGRAAAISGANGNIKSIEISDGIENIGAYAFVGCDGFNEDLTLPSTLKSIGDYAFTYCSGLTGNIIIPDNVETIGKRAFRGCTGFTGRIQLPYNENFKTISQQVFGSCSGLQGDIIIPDSVTTIEKGAFESCTNANGTLTLSDNLTTIGNAAFDNCLNLTGDIKLPDSIESVATAAFQGCSNMNGSIYLGKNIKTIGSFAFNGCNKLTGSLVIPDGVTVLDEVTFQGCYSLDGTLTLPKNLTSIGKWAFNGCKNLKGNIVIPDSVTSIGSTAFQNCASFTGSLDLPQNLTFIGSWAFSGCKNLSGDLTIPPLIKDIDRCAFQSCGFNGTLTLNDGLQRIGRFAFYDDRFNNELTIPNSVTFLGNAFMGKNILLKNTTIKLPDSLEVFGGDTDSSDISNWDNVNISSHMFYNVGEQSGLKNPIQAYEISESNPNFKTIDGVLYSKDGKRLASYPRGKADTEFTIPEGVENIDEMAFSSTKYLRTINLPDSYTLRNEVFAGSRLDEFFGIANTTYTYSSLGYVNVNESNTKYTSDDGVLFTKDMSTLLALPVGRTKEYNIPDGVTTITDYAFTPSQTYYYNVVNLTIPVSVTTISDSEIARINAKCSSVTVVDDNPIFTTVNGKLAKK